MHVSLPLAAANLDSPIFWAVVIGWIISVVLHEFAHGLVGHFGGDYTVRERGGLTLNPLQYLDPLTSIALPIFFLMRGGVPLPGGVTRVRTDLLRSSAWETAVSLAGPAANLLVMLMCLLPLHPSLGLFNLNAPVESWSNAQLFLAATAVLQMIGIVLNLLPIPPLDGFNAVSPYLPPQISEPAKLPAVRLIGFLVLYTVLSNAPGFWQFCFGSVVHICEALGMGNAGDSILDGYSYVLFR